jgi:rhamnogalacturonyl hydrolase YesR
VLNTITLVNNYWIAQNPVPGNSDWTQATYFTGDLAAYTVTGQANYLNFAESWAYGHGYSLDGGNSTNYANYQAAGQVYIALSQLLSDPSDAAGITQSVNGMVNSSSVDEWYWIDAINMSMPDFTDLGAITGNSNYLKKMNALYNYTRNTLGLYNKTTGLWWENSSYKNTTTYWSRGNGWVFAALAKVLSVDPSSDANRLAYINDFQSMAAALLKCQQSGGYWNSDLGNTNDSPGPESSGTSFFLYGFAWGVNNGILNAATYEPAIASAWNFLANTAVQPSGLLGYVQPTGGAPALSTAWALFSWLRPRWCCSQGMHRRRPLRTPSPAPLLLLLPAAARRSPLARTGQPSHPPRRTRTAAIASAAWPPGATPLPRASQELYSVRLPGT